MSKLVFQQIIIVPQENSADFSDESYVAAMFASENGAEIALDGSALDYAAQDHAGRKATLDEWDHGYTAANVAVEVGAIDRDEISKAKAAFDEAVSHHPKTDLKYVCGAYRTVSFAYDR